MSAPTGSAPPEWGASELIPTATVRNRQANASSATARHQLALARAAALPIVTSATASGVLEPTPAVLSATAGLVMSVLFDIWVSVEAVA